MLADSIIVVRIVVEINSVQKERGGHVDRQNMLIRCLVSTSAIVVV